MLHGKVNTLYLILFAVGGEHLLILPWLVFRIKGGILYSYLQTYKVNFNLAVQIHDVNIDIFDIMERVKKLLRLSTKL